MSFFDNQESMSIESQAESCVPNSQIQIGEQEFGLDLASQGPSLGVFVKKKVQRCGVWQIKPMTSPDKDQLSTKSNMCGFGGYSIATLTKQKSFMSHQSNNN